MKHELDKMMSLIKDYKTGYGGVTDSFMRKELELFAKDYHTEQCNIADVVKQSELLKLQVKKYRELALTIPAVVGQSEQFNCFLEDSEQGERCDSRCKDCKEYKGSSN